MDVGTLIGVGIGLALVYVIISLLASQINVFISNALNIRAETLRLRLQRLLFNSAEGETIMKHPLVGIIADKSAGLKGDIEEQKNRVSVLFLSVVSFIYHGVARVTPKRLTDTVRISNIAPDSFSKAVLNILNNTDVEELHDLLATAFTGNAQKDNEIVQKQNVLRLLKEIIQTEEPFNTELNKFEETLPEMLHDKQHQQKAYQLINNLRDLNRYLVRQKNIMGDDTPTLEVALLQYGVSRIKSDPLRRALDSMLVGVKTVEEAETAIEAWYNRKLAQTKDMYTRYMQNVTMVTGIILVLILNIDSVHIARSLWYDPNARAAIEEQVVNSLQDLEQSYETTMQAAQLSTGDTTSTEAQEELAASLNTLTVEFQANLDLLSQLEELNVPMGWRYMKPDETELGQVQNRQALVDATNVYYLWPGNEGGTVGNLVMKFVGLLLSSVAIAQGAPFWFDILRMLTGRTSPSTLETKDVADNVKEAAVQKG